MTKLRSAVVVAAGIALVAASWATSLAGRTVQPVIVASIAAPGGDYKIDPAHSIIGFSIRHLEINWVEGRFKDFTGIIHFDPNDVTKSSVDFTAKVDSIDTGIEPRNGHLKSPDFFDAAKYPELIFKSTGVNKGNDGYVLHGDLALKGVTKPVAIPFTLTNPIKDPFGNMRVGIEGHTKIDRRDYGITWGHALPGGGFDVGNDVTINLFLEAYQPIPKTATK
jgi:polyisoprenoid-binding protein YceI